MKKHRDVLNLTAWVLPETKNHWDKQKILELGNKEIGVSDDRILRILHEDKYISFDEIVQELINTEAENTFNTLQKLALSEIIESDKSGNKWRLKHESGK